MNRNIAPPIHRIAHIHCPEMNEQMMANNVPLYTIHDKQSEVIKIEFVFEAGKWYEEKNLIADFTNRLMREGTADYSSFEIAETFDFYGANLESYTSFSSAGFVLYCLAKNCTRVFAVLQSILTAATFPENEITTVTTNRKEKWKEQLLKTEYVANRLFLPAMWGENHPYGRVSEAADFENISKADLAHFHSQFYIAERMKIIAAGKISNELIAAIDELCKHINTGQNSPNNNQHTPAPFQQKTFHQSIKDAAQASVLIGCSTITKNHPDYLSLTVLNTVLGGYFGARLMKNIREEKGYTYGIYSAISGYQHGGVFEVSAEVNKDYAQKTIAEVKLEIAKLQHKKIGLKELTNVQNYMAGRLLRNVDGALKYSEVVKGMIQFRQSPTYINDYLQTIYSTTPDQIIALANQYLSLENMYEVIVD